MTEFINQLGPYQLHTEFQRGPIAHLYRATDTRNGQTVMVHLLAPPWVEEQSIFAAFLKAGKAAQALQHANIVPILECDVFGGQPYIVTKFASDQTLGQMLRRRGQRLENRDVLTIVEALAAALDAVHKQGLIHGALGFDTIYVNAERKVLLDAFYTVPLPHTRNLVPPAATHAGPRTDDQSPAANATPAPALVPRALPRWPVSPFMAPEQARDEATLDQRTDVYSLGAITYTLLLGKLPFVAADRGELVRQIIDQLPAAPETIDPTIATGVAFVLKSALAKDPAIRYSTAGEFVGALAQGSWLGANPPPPPKQLSPIADPQSTPKRSRRAAWLVTALLLLTALALGFLVSNQNLRARLLARLPGVSSGIAQPAVETRVGLNVAIPPTTTPPLLTPQVMLSLTPATPTSTTPTAVRIAPAMTPLISTTTPISTPMALDAAALSSTPTLTLTVRTSVKISPTATITSAITLSTPVDAEQALRIDPLGLLAGSVTAGDIVINGEAAPNTPLRILLNDQPIGETVVKSTGTWSIIAKIEELGNYEISVEAIDATGAVAARSTHTLQVVAATAPVEAIAAQTVTATVTVRPTTTATARPSMTPTRTQTTTPPPPTLTSTPRATATASSTNTPTATNTALPTATPRPTNTVVLQPTATVAPTQTATRQPTATRTPRATNTPIPTATNTRVPTATNTRVPTATNTPIPTAPTSPIPTATNTPIPTATNTPIPTATNTPIPPPTATPLPPTATNTAVPTWTPVPTNTPAPTATNTPVPPPTVASGQVTLVEPIDGTTAGGQRNFRWSANFTPSAGTAFELVFWRPGEDPVANGFGLAAPTTGESVSVDLDALDDILGERLDNGDEYRWGILLVRTEPYTRVNYLGGGYVFIFSRSDGGGGGGNGGPSSGE